MSTSKNSLLVVLSLIVLGVVLALLYRSTTHEELPDDEWLDFEHPR